MDAATKRVRHRLEATVAHVDGVRHLPSSGFVARREARFEAFIRLAAEGVECAEFDARALMAMSAWLRLVRPLHVASLTLRSLPKSARSQGHKVAGPLHRYTDPNCQPCLRLFSRAAS